MKLINFLCFTIFLFTANLASAQNEALKTIYTSKDFNIKTTPNNADVFAINSNGGETKLGTGNVDLHMEKGVSYTIEVRKEGFQPVRKIYVREKGGIDEEMVELENRVVKINASPADSRIYADNVNLGKSPQEILIKKGQSVTVDVKYPGFKTQTQVYYNKAGADVPETSHLFKMQDRLISLKAVPNDANILIDGKKVGDGNYDAVIIKDNCINVQIEHSGFVSVNKTYCNKDNESEPPMSDELTLVDRIAQINVQPEDAKIYVDDKMMGKGSLSVKILQGKCVDVLVTKPGYSSRQYTLCNKTDYPAAESTYPVKLDEDEAYLQSAESSDKANKNFTIAVNANIPPAEAWKKMTSIVQKFFDEIQTIDEASSYLMTNWVPATFNASEGKIPNRVRTSVIVTGGGTNPLSYNVKIKSEISKISCFRQLGKLPPVNQDECYEEFTRILRKYEDLISQMQLRLK